MSAQAYHKQTLGRMAHFLIPSLKLKNRYTGGATVEEELHQVLLRTFGGYTASSTTCYGFWLDNEGKEFYGEHREYTVAFVGKERVPELERLIADIASQIGEQCIYLETGEDACLIYATGNIDT